MDGRTKAELVNAMMKVIHSEGLPVPERISIRQPRFGVRRTKGRCIYRTKKGDTVGGTTQVKKTYRIIISTTMANFIPDPNGTLKNSKGETFKKGLGREMSKPDILETAAHEIAHLKHFHHGAEHVSYTFHIKQQLDNLIGWM